MTRPSGPDAPRPSSAEAEEALLGCMLTAADAGTDALAWAAAEVPADALYGHARRTLFELLVRMHLAGEPVDMTTVAGRLVSDGLTGTIALNYLADLGMGSYNPASYRHYGTIIAQLARVRAIIDEGVKLATLAADPANAEPVAARAAQRLQELLTPPAAAELTGDALVDALGETIDLTTSPALATWGLVDLDKKTRGLIPGRLILVAARPGIGKSSLAIQTAATVAARGLNVMVWSYEMSAGEVAAHTISALTSADLAKVMNGTAFTGGHVEDLAILAGLPLRVCTDAPDVTTLAARTAAAHRRGPLALVVVDYIQLIPPSKDSKAGNREQQVAEVSRTLKQLAQRLRVPVLACAQLNRNADGRRPYLADLRESGSLEMDADQVIFLHRADEGDRVVEAIVAKNRMGKTGDVRLAWRPEVASFANLAMP